ncbi:MAG: filamentous hemagglutinin N-terminal domain-containing protein [Verrucomicrobiota bacterium]|jgi:filamentous hemagglutinin family protein
MKIRRYDFLLWRALTGFWLLGLGWQSLANPTGMTVQSGSATVAANGSRLAITTSPLAVLNWQSFNIGAGETTIFNQPSVSSVVVNNIHDANASQIYGSLQANGMVVLMNKNGFYFGPNSFIQTAGLIVSTANCIPPQNSGGSWEFNGPPPLASIVNYGQIQIGNGGSAFLIADQVENHGDIEAPGGTVGLASGQTVLLSERPDGRGMSMQVTLPKGSVNNYGTIVADGGTIAMNAKVVNQNGFVQANSVSDRNGVIELVASDQLNLGAGSQILARGDDSAGGSSGGSVTVRSGNNFSDDVGSRIDVSGGSQGGNGGGVEISAPNISSLNSSLAAGAQAGWNGGELFLDPVDIVLGASSANGMVNVNSAFSGFAQILLQASGDITLNANTAWNLTASSGQNSGQLTLEAGNNIIFQNGSSIADGNNWSVNLAAGYDFVNNIIQPGIGSIYLNGGPGMAGGGSIQTANGGVSLAAGQDITIGSGYVITKGSGSIYAHALAGSIDTGSDAQGYHFVNNAASLGAAYNLNNGLGGISTAGSGSVTLVAGGNVTSVLPGKGAFYYDGNQATPNNGNDYLTAGSGAYGSGNVTIVAGGNVTGHYLLANGAGKIIAGAEMGASGNPIMDASGNYVLGASGSAGTDLSFGGLALSLVTGGWNVAAAQNILLQEVRNPNGDFNASGAFSHYFNYAPRDYVNLSAGNLVQLGASSSLLPRLSGGGNNSVPVIYPSILNIAAGVGGVILGSPGSPTSLSLFPSPQGGLTLDTTGSLVSALNSVGGAPQLFNLVVSDAGHNQYTTAANFGAGDHSASPIHLNNPTPIDLDIAGDMDLVNLVVPEAAQINVGGNMVNCGFQGMNLSPAPGFQVQIQEADGSARLVAVDPGVTSINVAGDIINRSIFTDLSGVTAAQAANLFYLSEAVANPLSEATLAGNFYYDPATETLTYRNIAGTTLLNVLNLLNNLTVQQFVNGVPQWEDTPSAGGPPPYDTIPLPAPNTVSVLGNPATPGTVAYALLAQYNALGAIPNNASTYGYTIGGGGEFDITARTMDLGTSAGIQSEGVAFYSLRGGYPLAGLFGNGGVFNRGADINLTTTGNHSADRNANGDLIGDLDMYSSSIASLNGGDISINTGSDVNAGSSVLNVSGFGATGIYSASQGDVSVIAGGDINVNGSRIATYDGGNLTVESLNGSINAGTGASSPVGVTGYYEDPGTHAVYFTSPQIPFSGIVAMTFPPRDAAYPAPDASPGNILVEAPNGDITANVSGILQIPLNKLNYPDADVTVLAGYELRDNMGNPVNAGDLADGTPALVSADRDINATGSGIIASNAKLDASGNVNGLIFARNNIDINAQQNVNVTALGAGNVNVNSSGGTISGTLIGVGGVNASGSSIDASLVSANVSGATSGQSGLGQGTAANATAQAASSDDASKAVASSDQSDDDDKKKKKEVALAQKTGRVTVILPASSSPPSSSQKQTATQPL